jgi:hypothetical protein
MWICITVICSVLYGIINDQITATISPEYYTVYKHHQFTPALEEFGLMEAPMRVQAIVIGTLATWWYGLFLGIMLGISSMVGRYAPLSTLQFMRIVGAVMAFTLAVSVIFGLAAYIVEPLVNPTAASKPFLTGIQDIRSAYCVGNWHNGSYIAAMAATLYASFWAQKKRRKTALAEETKTSKNMLT